MIGILEADFNTALKIFFSKKLRQYAEAYICIHNSIDAALQKMIMFEFGQFIKITIAMFAGDQQ